MCKLTKSDIRCFYVQDDRKHLSLLELDNERGNCEQDCSFSFTLSNWCVKERFISLLKTCGVRHSSTSEHVFQILVNFIRFHKESTNERKRM
jgi:hypothetical protein